MRRIAIVLLLASVCASAQTKLRLHNTPSTVTGYKAMDLSLGPAGAPVVTAITNATASGTDIQVTATAGGSTLAWISEPLASGFTLSGTVTGNPYTKESVATANTSIRFRLYKYSGGTEGSAIATCQASAEATTSITVKGCTATPTSTVFSAGDRIVAKMFLENCSATSGCPTGTMGTGTNTVDYDGGTDAVDGSTWIQINENVTFSAESAGHAIWVQFGYTTGTGWSVSDDGSNTYNQGPTCSGNGYNINSFYAMNVAAARKITITHSGGTVVFFSANAAEISNVAASSALNASSCSADVAGATVTAGSLTPTVTGDMLIQTVFDETWNPTTAYTVGSQSNISWNLLFTKLSIAEAAQYGVYSSTSAINPTFTRHDTGANWLSNAIAFKPNGTPSIVRWVASPNMSNTGQSSAAGANMALFLPDTTGTGTTGMYIRGVQSETYQATSTSPNAFQFPHLGNLVVDVQKGGGDDYSTSISSTPSHTWTNTGSAVVATGPASYAVTWCSDTGNSGSIETLSISATNHNATQVSDDDHMWLDIVGAASNACATAGDGNHDVTGTGNQTGVTPVNGVTYTPKAATSLITGQIAVDFNTVNSITATGCLIQNGFLSTNSAGNTPYYENNGQATCLGLPASSFQMVWNLQSGLGANTGLWSSRTTEFIAPVVSSIIDGSNGGVVY